MTEYPTAAHRYGIDPKKATELDRDRSIVLTEPLAQHYADAMNAVFAGEKAAAIFTPARTAALAMSINSTQGFPFAAGIDAGKIILTPSLEKLGRGAVLKDISDGFTETYKAFMLTPDIAVNEHFKFSFSQLCQAPLYGVYCAAGMFDGPHTKYTLRGC